MNLVVLLAIAGWRGSAQDPVCYPQVECPSCAPCLCASPTPAPTSTPTPTPTGTPVAPTPTPTPVPGAALRVGHITDLHAGSSRNNVSGIEYALRGLVNRADVVVDTGDCTEYGSSDQWTLYQTWMGWVQPLLWKAVAGNHDPTFSWDRNWTWNFDQCVLVGLDWINPDLDALAVTVAGAKPVLVFGHTPIFEYQSGADQTRLCELLSSPVVLAYVHGHVHQWLNYYDSQCQVQVISTYRSGLGNSRVMTVTNGILETVP